VEAKKKKKREKAIREVDLKIGAMVFVSRSSKARRRFYKSFDFRGRGRNTDRTTPGSNPSREAAEKDLTSGTRTPGKDS
jgi:hypothetical protein